MSKIIKFESQQQINDLAKSSPKLKSLRTFLSGYNVLATTDPIIGAEPFIAEDLYIIKEMTYDELKEAYPKHIYSINITNENYIDVVYVTDINNYMVIYPA